MESARLLDELIALSAELEADAVATLYRFGASRAYDEIVNQRLEVLQETPIPGYETWSAFLRRRQAPAMRTCRTVSERQETFRASSRAPRTCSERASTSSWSSRTATCSRR